ncbi:hypothetical protein [Egicoccus halophilus]|uniref:Uncharacterized protein n=1 Tax=Egicoccus halophilus TaxID=1670830 RepID=A0A8J3AAX5_9ACTN|nr:hypothetical protein [Egicoccus halophilus]GGI07039.1 hypothetical protein GCM10011354_22100 [Egicoccus halophilus]
MRVRASLTALTFAVVLFGCDDAGTEGGPVPLDETTESPDDGAGDN